MRFFPWFTEAFRSPLPPAELLHRVQQATRASATWGIPNTTESSKPFQGWVKDNSLRISRITRHNGKYYPALVVTEGNVLARDADGSRLQLLYRPALSKLLMLGFWLVLAGTLVLVSLIGWLRGQSEYASWGPTGIFFTIVTLFTLSFWWEVRKSRLLLVALLSLARVIPAHSS